MEKSELLGGGLVCLDQLHGNLINTIHEGFVHHSKPTLPQSALLVFRGTAYADVLPAPAYISINNICCKTDLLEPY